MTDEDRRDERDSPGGGNEPRAADEGPTAERTGPRREAAGSGDEGPEAGPGRPADDEANGTTDGGGGQAGGDGPGPGGWSGAISEMQNLVGDVVDEVLEGVRDAAGRRFPRVDMVRRRDGDYVVLVDLPGVDRDQVKVTTLGGELTISGERPRPELDEGSEVLRTERGYGSFRRTLRMPPDIREEDVAARLEEGVLEVRLPRKEPSDARTVDID